MPTTVGCLFCRTRGTVSNVNAHLRYHLNAYDKDETPKGSEYHHMAILAAWAHQTKPRLDIAGMDEDRVEVLLTFAKHVTTPPMTDEESEAWKRRSHWPQNVEWWTSNIEEVEEVYLDSGRNPGAMRNKTQRIVCRSKRRSLNGYHKNAPIIRAVQSNTIRGADMTGMNQLNMFGDGISYRRNIRQTPAPPGRKKSAYRTYHGVSSDGEDGGSGSDDDDSRYIIAAGPGIRAPPRAGPGSVEPLSTMPKPTETRAPPSTAFRRPETRAPPSTPLTRTETRVTVPSSPPSNTPAAGKLPAVAAMVSTTKSIHAETTSITTGHENTEMGHFATIDLWGIDNRRTVLPICYGTTLAGALEQATPAILKSAGIKVCFEGVGTDWAGEWEEWRWEMIMQAAEIEHVRVELRLVVVVDEMGK